MSKPCTIRPRTRHFPRLIGSVDLQNSTRIRAMFGAASTLAFRAPSTPVGKRDGVRGRFTERRNIQHSTSNTEYSIPEAPSDQLDVECSMLNVGRCQFLERV